MYTRGNHILLILMAPRYIRVGGYHVHIWANGIDYICIVGWRLPFTSLIPRHKYHVI